MSTPPESVNSQVDPVVDQGCLYAADEHAGRADVGEAILLVGVALFCVWIMFAQGCEKNRPDEQPPEELASLMIGNSMSADNDKLLDVQSAEPSSRRFVSSVTNLHI